MLAILYTGKLPWQKTFVFQWEKVIHGKTFAIAILETYIDQKGHDLPLSKKP